MKTTIIKTLVKIIFLSVHSLFVFSQTNVSGGIYTNTTWTLANSPYIIVDTTVVFPNVTLTIEPGVVVKFENNKSLEIRQGSLIAIGTINDSITFTSNSSSPTVSSWDKIYLHLSLPSQFAYCNFRYGTYALNNVSIPNLTTIKNSKFEYNYAGLFSDDYFNYCDVDSSVFTNNNYGIKYQSDIRIDHSIISNNQTGLRIPVRGIIKNCIIDSNSVDGIWTYDNDSIFNCEIVSNGIGLECGSTDGPNIITNNVFENNNIGIKLHWKIDEIYCNRICNNIQYDLYYDVSLYNMTIPNNYWCSTDSATIASHIYDGYDNIGLALISFMPIDTSQCFLITSINEPVDKFDFTFYPNPIFNSFTFSMSDNFLHSELKIFNLLGELEYSINIEQRETAIDISELSNGVHIVQLISGKNIKRKNLIKQ